MANIDDNEICDLADEIRGLVVLALGEDEAGTPPDHPLAQRARRELSAVRETLVANRARRAADKGRGVGRW